MMSTQRNYLPRIKSVTILQTAGGNRDAPADRIIVIQVLDLPECKVPKFVVTLRIDKLVSFLVGD